MATYTIRLITVERVNTVDENGDPVSFHQVTFKVVDWPELGPWMVNVPEGSTRAQARAMVDAMVTDLAVNKHEWYGIEWTLTV